MNYPAASGRGICFGNNSYIATAESCRKDETARQRRESSRRKTATRGELNPRVGLKIMQSCKYPLIRLIANTHQPQTY